MSGGDTYSHPVWTEGPPAAGVPPETPHRPAGPSEAAVPLAAGVPGRLPSAASPHGLPAAAGSSADYISQRPPGGAEGGRSRRDGCPGSAGPAGSMAAREARGVVLGKAADKLFSLSGLFAVYKPKGPTSAGVLNLLKERLLAGRRAAGRGRRGEARRTEVRCRHPEVGPEARGGVLVVKPGDRDREAGVGPACCPRAGAGRPEGNMRPVLECFGQGRPARHGGGTGVRR